MQLCIAYSHMVCNCPRYAHCAGSIYNNGTLCSNESTIGYTIEVHNYLYGYTVSINGLFLPHMPMLNSTPFKQLIFIYIYLCRNSRPRPSRHYVRTYRMSVLLINAFSIITFVTERPH